MALNSDVQDLLRKRAKGKCERCGSSQAKEYNCHHSSEAYRYLFREKEVMHLLHYWCRDCHAFFHKKSDYDPLKDKLKNKVTLIK